jgi:hypothetical protein
VGTELRTVLLQNLSWSQTSHSAYVKVVDGRYVLTVDGSSAIDGVDLGPASEGVAPSTGMVTWSAETSGSQMTSAELEANWCVAFTHPQGTGNFYRCTALGGLEVVTQETACYTGGRGTGAPGGED